VPGGIFYRPRLVERRGSCPDVARGEVALTDLRAESHTFVMEAFHKGRMLLAMLVEKRASRPAAERCG
jgi:hypothetical protein